MIRLCGEGLWFLFLREVERTMQLLDLSFFSLDMLHVALGNDYGTWDTFSPISSPLISLYSPSFSSPKSRFCFFCIIQHFCSHFCCDCIDYTHIRVFSSLSPY